jgi:hypothetical protein
MGLPKPPGLPKKNPGIHLENANALNLFGLPWWAKTFSGPPRPESVAFGFMVAVMACRAQRLIVRPLPSELRVVQPLDAVVNDACGLDPAIGFTVGTERVLRQEGFTVGVPSTRAVEFRAFATFCVDGFGVSGFVEAIGACRLRDLNREVGGTVWQEVTSGSSRQRG